MPSIKNRHRLPSHIRPSRYRIFLRPDLEKFTFTGEETIFISTEKPVKEITLHAVELEIASPTFKDSKGRTHKGKVSYNKKAEAATFSFPSAISAGEGELQLKFTGILNDKMRGFYRSKYEVDGEVTHMVVTQFESTDARRAFPSFDEPSMKAVFDVTLMVPGHTTAISNTVEQTVTEHESGYKIVEFSPTPKMSTYLLAFVVGKFEYVEKKTKQGVLVRVFVAPGKKRQAEFALETAAKTLSFYNEYFDISYPLPVLDLIAVPDFAAGAMENWGAVTFRETALLVDPEHTSLASKQWVALVIAHELAHMWFGDLVTMEWWTHLWLNEGFACFIEYLAVNELFPEWDIWTQFIATEHNGALSLDGLKNTHPIEVEVKHPSEISEIFDEVSYAKGANVIKMLETYLGSVDFRDGLRHYLKKHAYKNAKTEDLWDAFEKVSKKPVRKLMQNWTKKPGYPIISIKENKKQLILSQKRYFSSSLSSKTPDKTVWNIPLSIKTEEDENSGVILMDKKSLSIQKPLADSWIKINSGESTLLRVSYPQKYIEEFKGGIASGTLSAIDRLGVIRDAFDLAESGYASTADALSLAAVYKDETNFTVWMELAGSIHKLASLIHSEKEIEVLYKPFAKNLFVTIAKKMGWEKFPNEKHTDTLLRSTALYGFGTYGDRETIQKAQMLFKGFALNKKTLDPDIRGVVYTLVAENGGEEEYNIFVELHRKETLHQEKDRLARALASFTQHNFLQKTLSWSLSDEVRAQDAPRVLYAVFANPFGRYLAWDFVVKNWDYYAKQFAGSHGFSRVIEGASVFTSIEKAKEINEFFKKHKVPELNRTAKQVIEKIQANVSWLDRDKAVIKAFLKS